MTRYTFTEFIKNLCYLRWEPVHSNGKTLRWEPVHINGKHWDGNQYTAMENTVIERNKEEEKIKVKTHHAKCVNCESTEHAMTCVLIVSNSLTLSLNAMISVGHTNVLKKIKINIIKRNV